VSLTPTVSTKKVVLVAKLTAKSLIQVANLPPACSVVDTAADLPPVSLTTVANFQQQHRWCILTCKYLQKISKKFEMTPMLFSEAWGKMIHEKNLKQKHL
jgi:hypothetical protein